ncbi:unnamed protein product, partial [Discosporangium mesarthrocarpum]
AGPGSGSGGVGSHVCLLSPLRSRTALVAKACEVYREGVVLHQEAFFSSAEEKFDVVLETLDRADALYVTEADPSLGYADAIGWGAGNLDNLMASPTSVTIKEG